MKLETTIKPRRDGVVRVELDKSTYTFTEVDGQTTTIHELTSRPEWRW